MEPWYQKSSTSLYLAFPCLTNINIRPAVSSPSVDANLAVGSATRTWLNVICLSATAFFASPTAVLEQQNWSAEREVKERTATGSKAYRHKQIHDGAVQYARLGQ